ncbi:glycosyltransferase [Acinetobacter haemolyticus]|uniref:glycosyltransferase n=1 Tax=Acinetobacter haemolyticus TaxID=29430 RepID=UPI003EF1C227
MKVIFAHDHIFYSHSQTFYSNGGLSYEVLKRYINVFGEINVLSRQHPCQNLEEVKGLSIASGKGVKFVKIPNFKSVKGMKSYLSAKDKVFQQVKEADLVIARMPSSISSLVIQAAKKYKKPYLVEVVGCTWDANIHHGSILGKFLAPYSYIKMKNLIKDAPYTIYITKQFLQSRYPSAYLSAICPNVNIQAVCNSVLESRLKKIENFNQEQDIKLGLIGSLDVNYKGHEITLQAIKKLKEKGLKIFVEFLGKGSKERWLKLAQDLNVQDNVIFKGSLPSGEAVYKWLDSLDIMVQPSSAEAQGRSIIEGMSRGCPIISTRVGGIIELIDNVLLIEKGNTLALSETILMLVKDKDLMKHTAMANFNESKEYYADKIEKDRYLFLNKFKADQNVI